MTSSSTHIEDVIVVGVRLVTGNGTDRRLGVLGCGHEHGAGGAENHAGTDDDRSEPPTSQPPRLATTAVGAGGAKLAAPSSYWVGAGESVSRAMFCRSPVRG